MLHLLTLLLSLNLAPAAQATDGNSDLLPAGMHEHWLAPAEDRHSWRQREIQTKERAARKELQHTDEGDDPFVDYDVHYYELDLVAYAGENSLSGTITTHLEIVLDGLEDVVMHAASNLNVAAVRLGDTELEFDHTDDWLSISLPEAAEAGDTLVIQVDYVANYGGCGVLSTWQQNAQTGETIHVITTQAEPYDARCWWPCKDDTRDKADSVLVRVTTDDFNSVVSNGTLRLDEDNGNGTRTVEWFERWPIVTYLVSLCVTEYNHMETVWTHDFTEMPMHDWSWGLTTDNQQWAMNRGIEALDVLSSLYGTYPFIDEKYGHAQYTWGGAMEHQTCSSMGFYTETVIVHELSHQWWGDKVTCNTFHDIWLNEGWATYSEALYYEQVLGEYALHQHMDGEEYLGGGTIYVEHPETENIFDGNLSYSKGGWVNHMLRHVMGDTDFFLGIQDWLGPNELSAHRTATTAEFQDHMEEYYGDPLDWFFDEWIYGEYYPQYQAYWTQQSLPGGRFELQLVIHQEQLDLGRQLFKMPVDLRVSLDDGSVVDLVVWCEDAETTFTAELDDSIDQIELDPEDWILGPAEVSPMTDPDLRITDVQLYDTESNPISVIPHGDSQIVIALNNYGSVAANLEAELSITDVDFTILGSPYTLADMEFMDSDSLTLSLVCGPEVNGLLDFAFSMSWEGGSMNTTISLPAGEPEILLVDDDGGDAYEAYYTNALDDRAFYALTQPENLTTDALNSATLVVWFQGDQGRMLSQSERDMVDAYRAAGGHIVLTGQDLPSSQHADWIMGPFGSTVTGTDEVDNAVVGIENGPFAVDEYYFLFNGGAGNQAHMDRIESMIDCPIEVLRYHSPDGGGVAGVCDACFGEDAHALLLGFGLEGISGAGSSEDLSEVLLRLLAWARGEVDVPFNDPDARPTGFEITGAYPNPFNPSTVLGFTSPTAGELVLEVFNLRGQLVDQRNCGLISAGQGEISWNAEGLPSGVYLARLSVLDQNTRMQGSHVTKLLLVR